VLYIDCFLTFSCYFFWVKPKEVSANQKFSLEHLFINVSVLQFYLAVMNIEEVQSLANNASVTEDIKWGSDLCPTFSLDRKKVAPIVIGAGAEDQGKPEPCLPLGRVPRVLPCQPHTFRFEKYFRWNIVLSRLKC
jgi:hypothetical protein